MPASYFLPSSHPRSVSGLPQSCLGMQESFFTSASQIPQNPGFQEPFIPSPGVGPPQTDLSPSPRTQESPSCPVPGSKTSSPLLRAHPCWPPPRPPRREPYSPDRTHHPSPPVPAGRTRTKCGLEAWPRRERGLVGCEKWGVREESRVCTAQGSKSGSRCPTGSLQCPWLPIARPHPPPCRSPGTQAVVAASLNPSGAPAVEACGRQGAVPVPWGTPLVRSQGRGASTSSHWRIRTVLVPPPPQR